MSTTPRRFRPFALVPPTALALALAAAPRAAAAPQAGAGVDTPTQADALDSLAGDEVAAALARAHEQLDRIAAVPAGERTFENTVRAFDDAVARFFNRARMTAFLAEVHPEPLVRERGRAAREVIDEFFNTLTKREDLYRALRGFAETEPELSAVDARLLEHVLRDFQREGMGLGAEERQRLLELDRLMNEKGNAFRQNIADDDTALYLEPEELAGVPESFLGGLQRLAGLYVVPLRGAAIGRLLSTCEVEATRKKVSLAYSMRAVPENVELLEELLVLRAEKARLLGYETLAHYQTEVRMAETPERVMQFYGDLRLRLRQKALEDYEQFQAAKRADTGDADAKLHAWDYSYYQDRLLEEEYAVDAEALRAYFPMDAVTEGLFGITQRIYGLSYEEVTAQAEARGLPPAWHEDVRLYAVTDEASGALLGHFYVDLYPRPNKYTHAAQFPLRLRKEWSDGEVTLPLVALVCNFTKPTADQPSLLSHDEVETYFHEFGHCLHSILGESEHAWFSGTQVARDFVEAPSQMFEEWIWDPDVLQTFARHYETGETIPRELVEGLVAARNLGSGMSTEGQVFLGLLDMAYHTDPDGVVDTTAVRTQVYRDTRLFEPVDGLAGQASFGHLVGYEAGYYGYLWSLVYAADMAERFRELGLLDPAAGKAYREAVLSKGGTEDELDMVRAFLGREPNSAAFLRQLGLGER